MYKNIGTTIVGNIVSVSSRFFNVVVKVLSGILSCTQTGFVFKTRRRLVSSSSHDMSQVCDQLTLTTMGMTT